MKKVFLGLMAATLFAGSVQAYRFVDKKTEKIYNKVIRKTNKSKELWNIYLLNENYFRSLNAWDKKEILYKVDRLEGKPFNIVLPKVSAIISNLAGKTNGRHQLEILSKINKNIAFLSTALSYAHEGKRLERFPGVDWTTYIQALEGHIRQMLYYFKNSFIEYKI